MNRKVLCLCAAIAFVVAFPLSASADMGPKPSITILVENPPQGEYYLDLLVPYQSEWRGSYGDGYDAERLRLLEEYDVDGWYPALLNDDGPPLYGSVTGDPRGDVVQHYFSYSVPNRYKIIVVTPEGEVRVTGEHNREVFSETVYLDYETMRMRTPSIPGMYAKQIATTLTATLLIEGGILLLFRFSLRENWKAFVGINVATQLFMTVTLGRFLVDGDWLLVFLAFIPVELLIMGAEMIACAKLLKGHSKGRRVGYAAAANAASAILGVIILPLQHFLLN